MLVDVEFASWETAQKALPQTCQSVIIDRENFDRILILDQHDYDYEDDTPILKILDITLGGDWIDLNPKLKDNCVELVRAYYIKKPM